MRNFISYDESLTILSNLRFKEKTKEKLFLSNALANN